MKDGFKNIDSSLCDKFFNFIYPNENSLTDKEVNAELKRLKIDTRSAMDKVSFAISMAKQKEKAQVSFANAKQRRKKVLEMFNNITSSVSGTREQIKQLITQALNGPQRAAFFRKLEESSEEDLKSLANDILRLEELKDSFDDEK